jgi:ribosomal protein S18 acetylase RimI-like enzyme
VQRDITLRPATDADRDFLYQVYASTRQEEMALVPWDDAGKRAFLTMQFEAQHYHYHTYYDTAEYLIILADDQPAGRIYVARWEHEIRLMEITLLPEYRGGGIGTALIEDLLAEARATDRIVGLHVEPFNRALRLYERLGFTKAGEEGIYWFMEWRQDEAPGD